MSGLWAGGIKAPVVLLKIFIENFFIENFMYCNVRKIMTRIYHVHDKQVSALNIVEKKSPGGQNRDN